MIKPRVSIIIPVYNGSNYLQDAIESAINQDYCNYEIIVVNDGSTDNGKTEEIAMNYSNFIRYYKKENGGVASALNYGISKMEGDYFSWLSHDDIYDPNKLSSQINALYELGDLKAPVYSNYQLWDMNTNTVQDTSFHSIYSMKQLTNSVFPIIQWLTLSCTPLIHKSLFDEVGLFDESLLTAQDYDMWFRLFRNRKSVFVKEALLKSRLHLDSGTNTIKSFGDELGKTAVTSILSLTEREIIDMFGHPAIIYHRMAMILKGYNLPYYYKEIFNKLQNTVITLNDLLKLKDFNGYFKKFCREKSIKICIFGVGKYGNRLYWELTSRLIYIDYFSDNNKMKWGKLIEGKECLSIEQLKSIKNDVLVIIAVQMPDSIIAQLKKEGFPFITTMQQLELLISKYVPLKWISALEYKLNHVNTQDEIELKENLECTIFDMSRKLLEDLSWRS